MADGREDNDTYPRWLSITGEQLDLDLPNGLLGRSPDTRLPPILASLLPLKSANIFIWFTGKCRSIDDYKKLNHLGEGSTSHHPPNGVGA